jgi:hypothetical protein
MHSDDVEKEIDDALARGQSWEPPAHFARTVAAQAIGLAARERAARELVAGPFILRPAGLGVLAAAATAYLAYLVVLAPMAGWLASDRAVAALDAYVRFMTQASDAWAANALPVAWTSVALSLAVAAWFTRGLTPFAFRPR